MKKSLKYLILTIACSLSGSTRLLAQDTPFATYAGASPCGNILKPLLGVANEPECEFTKWTLTLYPQKVGAQAMVKLAFRYGVGRPNTSGFIDEKSAEFEGLWTILKGTKDKPDATVYQITLYKAGKPLLFVKLSDNSIHLLDSQRALMIGNSGYSYTLSKQTP